ncbi:Ig-like domain-containing protein [Herbinix luporum]|jgi:hypothetical protein|uniref:BIG2 domain-containing protein n=1 Tax=Herbinix luporum TaxID=1679721 RepID=A0A0K8J856_9FIRM|nr:Ig-like domain-containing protein [Herbinix luporum]MDI9488111.1 Ig-like domain-containing protein [Bacillota bacterium]CUH93497.1 hypothetical protein SD1D_1959 [Herbinix luporum]HHT56381.1 hypothetical protein [Herbinix luporum]
MKKKFLCNCLILFGLLLFFTVMPQIIQSPLSVVRASEVEKEKNNEYRLNLKSITLVNGKSFTLKVYNLEDDAKVSFKSADPSIASVNENGTFKANKVGSTTITATVRRGSNSTSLTCDVKVGPPAFSVKMTRSIIILGQKQSALLEVIMKPSNTAELAKFSSFNSSIASVSSGGRVTAKRLGMTYIFAEIDAVNLDGSKKFASCSVIVTKPEEVTQLRKYFSNHLELSLISESDLSAALYEFFNSNNTTESNSGSESSIVDNLDKFLNLKFNLENLKKTYQERLQPVVEIKLSSQAGI